jgi:hypothetical protein
MVTDDWLQPLVDPWTGYSHPTAEIDIIYEEARVEADADCYPVANRTAPSGM